jgi:hypothetical protein
LVYWLIAAALLANAAVFYWRYLADKPAPALQADIGRLQLLDELETDAERKAIAASKPEAPAVRPKLEQAPEPVAPRVPAGTGSPAVSTDPESEAVEAAPPANDKVAEAALPQRCWLAGPVVGEAMGERLLAAFAGAGVSMDLVLRTVEADPEHWVYLPTEGSQADIRRMSRELRQGGIDNFPITDGPLSGSLSLGLFRSEERAQAYKEAIAQKGYKPLVYLRPAFVEQPWAALTDSGLAALGWDDSGDIPGFPELRLTQRQCPGDAAALQLRDSLSRLAALGAPQRFHGVVSAARYRARDGKKSFNEAGVAQ